MLDRRRGRHSSVGLSNRIQLRPPFAANADPLQVARVTPLTEPRPASRSLT